MLGAVRLSNDPEAAQTMKEFALSFSETSLMLESLELSWAELQITTRDMEISTPSCISLEFPSMNPM